MTNTHVRKQQRCYWPAWPAQTAAMIVIFILLGTMLVLQSGRWARTPAYGNLLRILSADTWGYLYLGVGIFLAAGLVWQARRIISVMAHTVAFVLLSAWEAGFIVRYFTDSATTIVNVVSWGAYLFLLVVSAQRIDQVT